MPFHASLPELIVPGSWSCGTRTLSFARGKQTLGVKTHVCDWYFECTSTSPTAGQCPYRRLQTPSNVVSHAQTLAQRFSELLSWLSNRARGGIYCCKPISSAAVLLNTGQNPNKLYMIKRQYMHCIWCQTHVIYLNAHFMTECTKYRAQTTPLVQVPPRSFASPSFGSVEWAYWKKPL